MKHRRRVRIAKLPGPNGRESLTKTPSVPRIFNILSKTIVLQRCDRLFGCSSH